MPARESMDRGDLPQRLATVVVTMVTPFDEEGGVDGEALAAHARFLVDRGISVLVPCGNTGEFSSLSVEEAEAVVRIVSEAVGDRAAVLAGVGWSTSLAVRLARHAEVVGAHGVMIHHPVHPYLHPEGVLDHYLRIMEAVDLPVVLYKRGPQVPDQMLARLSSQPQVAGVKYAVNDLDAFARLVGSAGEGTAWICGTAERWAPFFRLGGAVGFTSGLANFAPRLALGMHRALAEGDWEEAMRLRAELEPFERLRDGPTFSANNVPAVKEAMAMLGLGSWRVREPLRRLEGSDRARVRSLLGRWGLLEDLPEARAATRS